MVRREWGGILRGLMLLILGLMFLVMTASVIYLRSDINRRQYRLDVRDNQLWVERGRFFPIGFTGYDPETADLRSAYAPVPMPPQERPGNLGPFEERGDLDRALFSLLSAWSHARLLAHDVPTLDLAALYIRRLEMLPGLSEEQRIELRGLRAGLAYRTGLRLIDQVHTDLEGARHALRTALELGVPEHAEAQRWIDEAERRLNAFPPRSQEDAVRPPVPTQAPLPSP